MSIRAFPETRKEPRKKVLLIPVILIFGGMALTMIHEYLRFIGAIIAFTGALTVFLVGMVYADLYAASRRTKDIIKAREERGQEITDEPIQDDPFLDTLDD